MIDGSRLPLEENINLTNKVIEIAHPVEVLVEGELGRVGGLEGDESWEEKSKEEDFFTSPQEAQEFTGKAPVDMLAVAVGTRHGLYKGRTHQLNALKKSERKPVYLVIHGGSGTSSNYEQRNWE